jgi:3-keto-5-aminohexanoate cleavage enzyme
MKPVIITVAGVGAELTPENTPYLPSNPQAIIEDACAVFEEGAAMYHLHVRDEHGLPTLKPDIVSEVVSGIRKHTDLIVQISTGGSIGDTMEDRLKVLVPGVEMGSLTLGSTNFGPDVFLNPQPHIEALAQSMSSLGIKPEGEIFDVSFAENLGRLVARNILQAPAHVNIILGGPGWLSATESHLDYILSLLPAGTTWTASGVGRFQKVMLAFALSRGGHCRTGLEDNIYVEKGVLAKGNRDLVIQLKEMADKAGRPLATCSEARTILGLLK